MIDCCPECGTSQVYERETKEPTYRCVNGHTFETPESRQRRHEEYTTVELLEDLRQLAKAIGRIPPRKRDMNDYGPHSGRTYQLRFGSWSNAVEAAGFTRRKPRREYQKRPASCPLCNSTTTGLDFHHWRYGDNEQGCYLCRDCHDAVHEGQASRNNPDWLKYCVKNLVTKHIDYGGKPHLDEIMDQYNLTHVEILVEQALGEATEQ